MSQRTFWDGEEKEDQKVGMIAAKIRLTNVLEIRGEGAKGAKPRKDFRIHKAREPEARTEEEKEVTSEHVAAQLVKLWKMGWIKNEHDPEALFYAVLIKESGGTVIEKSLAEARNET